VAHNSVHHLLQIPEYIAADDPRLSTVLERLGDAVISHKVLGTYAPPIVTDQTC